MHAAGAHAPSAAPLPADPPAAAAVAFGVLTRFLRRLPEPLCSFGLYERLLSASAAELPPLLRQLPPAHLSLLHAVGETCARLLRQCGVSVAAPTAEQRPHVQALLAALAPTLLWPAPRTAVPVTERGPAVSCTHAILRYYSDRLEWRRASGGSPVVDGAAHHAPAPSRPADDGGSGSDDEEEAPGARASRRRRRRRGRRRRGRCPGDGERPQ